jgi:type IV pilus assembly protein PilY1
VFVPNTDICVASGTGYLYALYYLTGGPYSSPVAGTTAAGANQNINDKLGGAQGVGAQASVQVIKGAGGGGSNDKAKVCQTTSTGAQSCATTNPAQAITSRYIAWINQRD